MIALQEEQIELNLPQMILTVDTHKHANIEGGRGLGKSFIVSYRIRQIVEAMPRAKCAIVGRTYEQLLTRTLPSTLNGLSKLGFVKNLHFFVGNRPPKAWNWNEPFEQTLSYDYCITFYNGTTFQLVSLDKTESGRGFNFDAVIGDEAALLDYDKLMNNVLLSMRGNLEHFSHTWLHYSTLFVSTTPVNNKGRWFTKREELARQNPADMMYLVAPSQYNLKNLGKEYFKTMKRELLPNVYNAEILCIRNGSAEAPFYATFDSKIHTYTSVNDNYLWKIVNDTDKLSAKNCRFDNDVDPTRPLDIALDYNSAINWLTVGQEHKSEYRTVSAFFVKAPKTLLDVVQDFCDYYSEHQKKEVNYFYDHTAVHKDAVRTTTYAEEVQKVLIKNGWKVNMIYCGQAPKHETKKLFFEILFKEQPPMKYPRVRLNLDNCKYLIVSIEQAEAIDGRDGQKKDKSSEKKLKVPEEEATHGSDAFDTLVYFRLTRGTSQKGYFV